MVKVLRNSVFNFVLNFSKISNLVGKRRHLIVMAGTPKDLNDKVKLLDGTEMPLFGLGVYQAGQGGPAQDVVTFALKHGYRLIDTAQFYNNEEDVGNAVRSSGIPRDKIVVVSKQWDHGYNVCKTGFTASFKKLNVGFVDLFLIHSPLGGKVLETYDAMIEFQKEGKIRSIGVSNFGVHHLEALKSAGKPTPVVNQIELHPFCKQTKIVEYCRKNNIAVMGYSPLGKGKILSDPTVLDMGKKYNKEPAQIVLRWSIQNGYITIPKSSHKERIVSNSDIYGFSLSKEDMKILNDLPEKPVTWNPVDTPWDG